MQTSKNNLMDAHTQWANRPADQRFQTLEALAAAVQARRLRSRSVDIDLGQITAGQHEQTIVLNHGIKMVEPTHWSFGQMSSWIHAPADYLRRLPAPLAVECINHGITTQARERGALKFMAISEPDRDCNTLQAVTSTTYGRIWDADCVQAVQRIVERTGNRFYNPKAYDPATGQPVPSGLYASDRDVFMFLIDGGSLLDAGPRAQLNRGFICWNSEVGARTFGLKTFLFNQVCGNHIIWGAQDVRELTIRHTQNGPYRFESEAAPSLLAYANASAESDLTVIRAAQALSIPDKRDELIDWIGKRGKFSRSEIIEAIDTAKREEGDCRTLWQLVQGLTAYARGYDYIDARVDLETRAGQLLNSVGVS